MFSPKNALSSSRQLFRKSVSVERAFSSLANATPSLSNPIPAFALFDGPKRTSTPHKTPEFPLYHKHDFLIEKYRFCSSDSDAKRFHLDIIKNGFGDDLFTGNTLINVYVRNGDVFAAHKVFDEIPERNSVTWSCLISGYTQNEMPRDALTALTRMVAAGFIPNHYVFGSALRACQRLGADDGLRHGTQIHGLVSKTRYAFDVVVCNVLISMYGSCIVGPVGSDYASRVFDGIENKNSVSYNSIISVYSQRGDMNSVFSLFSYMQKEGDPGFSFRPTEYTYGSLITAAAESISSYSGTLLLNQLLAKIEMSGFVKDLYVGSALVSAFAKFGAIDTAKCIFQQMGTRNAVSVNGLMVGLVKLNRGEESVEVFLETRGLVRLNSDSYVLLLTAFGEFSCLGEGKRKGKEVHGHLTRTGMSFSSISVGNSLINMYAKCHAIEDARSVFNMMIEKDSVTWSSIISGLDQNECFEEALVNFLTMKRVGLMPSNFTLISALSSCGSLRWIRLGEQIHCGAIKSGLDTDVSVSNTLISLYGDTGCITECRKIFSFMHDHDLVSWNSIMRAFSDSDTSITEATKYFIEMARAGWRPNSVSFINILSASSSLSHLELTRQIHVLVLKHRLMDYNTVRNSLLTSYGKCGEIDYCESIFFGSSERDEVSWNSMISGYIKSEKLVEAMDLVLLMFKNGRKLDHFTFATVLSACASVATLEHGMEVHACAVKACLAGDVVIGSALVDMYGKCGRVDYASRFFQLMPVRNVYSWNSMISGYARHGDGHKALEIFEQMKLKNEKPDNVTFVGVLSACSHVGLVNQGQEHFESMSEVYGLTPKVEHFSCMVDLLGRAGEFGKLEEFIDSMPVEPNVLIWRTVLGACGRSNGSSVMLGLGKRAAKKIIELEPQNAVNYVLIANMYASGGKWEDVAEARRVMKMAMVKKEAGCSWVSMRDGIHVFVSGDKVHPELGRIYEKLGELYGKMKGMGYRAEVGYALYDVEMENKEEVLSYHSEKLAVAFVLAREESGMPIRIMKNLRVCGDCHTVFKYVSEIVGRRIVLRDSNRFHHFVGGKCSCNDYW